MSALFSRLTGLELLEPSWLWLLLLLVPAFHLRRRQGEPAVVFAPEALVERGLGAGARRHARLLLLPRLLWLLGLLMLVVAIAHPVARIELPRRSPGIDVALVIDASSSMAATDLDPAGKRRRIDIVREAAARFVAARPDDRFAILRFARFPDLLCPLTLDHAALTRFLELVELVPEDSPEDATAIGAALARSVRLFEDDPDRRAVVVLLTDGEENIAVRERPDEIAPLHAAQFAADRGIRVHAIAAGRDGRDPEGRLRPIDHGELRRVGEKTGGRFFAAADAGAVLGVYDEIDRLEKQELLEPRYRFEERFLGFLVAALVLLLGGRVLRSTWLEVLP